MLELAFSIGHKAHNIEALAKASQMILVNMAAFYSYNDYVHWSVCRRPIVFSGQLLYTLIFVEQNEGENTLLYPFHGRNEQSVSVTLPAQ